MAFSVLHGKKTSVDLLYHE